MSGALVYFWPGAQSLEGLAPRVEERWSSGTGGVRRRVTVATVLILSVSILAHVGFVATALLREAPTAPQPQQEIAVEVVPEVPKAAKDTPKPAEKAGAAAAPKAAEPPQAAPPPPPPPEPKPVDKAEAPRPEAAEAQMKPSLPPQPKPETAKPDAPEQPKPDASKPEASKPEAPKSDAELKALQTELESLRAEHAALATQTAAAEPPAPPAAAPSGLGSLADSFQAVALPAPSETGDLPVGYAGIVFSQLAKAKAVGEEMGQPGTAGVTFAVDEKGALVGVQVVKSSGIKSLDDEALSIVHKAAPFPPPPPGAQRSFSANVSFVGRAAP